MFNLKLTEWISRAAYLASTIANALHETNALIHEIKTGIKATP